jgi:molybdopterin biosynthesis enzyme
VLVNAGSSAGKEDYTAQVVAELGEVIVHARVRPGTCDHWIVDGKKGEKYRKVPVIGVPGTGSAR